MEQALQLLNQTVGMADDTVESLQARVVFLENVLESLPVGLMVLDNDGKVLLVNRTQEKVSCASREEMVGQLFHEKWQDVLARNEALLTNYWSLLKEQKPYEFIFHDVMPQFHDMKMSGVSMGGALGDGQGAVMLNHKSQEIERDRYALASLAQYLAEAKESLQNLINSSPSAILTIAQDGRIRSANKTTCGIFGFTSGDLVWKPVSALFAEGFSLETLIRQQALAAGVESRCRRKGGELFAVRVQCNKMHGESKDRLLVITDISREKALEKRVAISEKLAIYSELVAGIFHQLNNPLVGVVNFSALLREKVSVEDPLRPLVETIYDATRQCQTLITTLMKGLSEPESTFNFFSIEELLRNEVERFRGEKEPAVAGQLQLGCRIEEHLPAVWGDQLQLGQVFQNLLNNAAQALSGEGRVEVSAELDRQKETLWVEFADSGCGIAEGNLEKIFTPFFTTKKNTCGGLGLSFCYRVMKNHGGRIKVASSVGQGSRFRLLLPLGRQQQEEGVADE